MDSKSLMIGDWVQNPLGWKAQVQSIRYVNTIKDEWEWLVKIGINNETFQDNLSLNEIGAIPLTAEILEKNGFTRLGTDYILKDRHFGLSNPSTPSNYLDNYWLRVSIKVVRIEFVHELQHALNLCGIEKDIEL